MRHGHRRRLLREGDREAKRGRTTFSRSVNRGSRLFWLRKSPQKRCHVWTVALDWDDAFETVCNNLSEDDGSAGLAVFSRCTCSTSAMTAKDGTAWAQVDEVYVPSEDYPFLASERMKQKQALSRWDQAQVRAARAASEYVPVRRPKMSPTTEVYSPVEVHSFPGVHSFPDAGKPLFTQEHNRVMDFAARDKRGVPRCWQNKRGLVEVKADSEEFDAVTLYFLRTVGDFNVQVFGLSRLEVPTVYNNYSAQGTVETVMFHGCKCAANEKSIIEYGFQVAKCVSGGPNFGTWFAYGAKYSNGGYAFDDSDGVRHLFVCIVSSRGVVKDDPTMRVVGQDCAYPLWLIMYKLPPPVPRAMPTTFWPPLLRVMPQRRPIREERSSMQTCRPFSGKVWGITFFIARCGRWVVAARAGEAPRR